MKSVSANVSKPGLPHPWKNPWNPWISCRSLNSLKSPWILVKILEDPWKVLESWKWSLKSLNFVLSAIHRMLILWIVAAMRHFHMACTQFQHPWKLRKDPWNILELSLDFVHEISWQPCKQILVSFTTWNDLSFLYCKEVTINSGERGQTVKFWRERGSPHAEPQYLPLN